VLELHLEQAAAALGDDGMEVEPRQRTVQTVVGPLTIVEAMLIEQSAASFAMMHRVLPQTDVTGLKLWPCTLTLLAHLVDNVLPELASQGRSRHRGGLRVIELGAGVGLLSLGVARWLATHTYNIMMPVGTSAHGPHTVVMTDPAIPLGGGYTSLQLLEAAIPSNADIIRCAQGPSEADVDAGVNCNVPESAALRLEARKLLWGDAADIARVRDEFLGGGEAGGSCAGGAGFDLVLGSELLYREDSVEALVETLAALLSSESASSAVLAQRTRPTGTMALEHQCIEAMARRGFSARTVDAGGQCLLHIFQPKSERVQYNNAG